MTHCLSDHDASSLRSLYEQRWREHGPTPQSLGWTKGKQDIRFDVLLSGLECEAKSVLDVGCGFGDLNRVLRQRTRDYTYHGMDLVSEFVDHGRSCYGGPRVTFEVGDFMTLPPGRDAFDYVVAAGAFSYRMKDCDNYEWLDRALDIFLATSRIAVSIDFLSDRVNYQQPHCFHFSPERVLTLALRRTRNVRLRHDYMPFEFAVTLFKDDSFDEHTLFRRPCHAIANP